MSVEELLAHLEDQGIKTTTKSHPPVFTVDEALEHWEDLDGVHVKNLFFKDAKKQYWLVSVPFDREINIKELPAQIGSKRLSFASADRLMEVLGLTPGSVSPLAVINDGEKKTNVVLDAWMMGQDLLNLHPLDNSKTTQIAPNDLLKFLKDLGFEPNLVEFA